MDSVTTPLAYLDLLKQEVTVGSRVAYAAVNYKRAVQRTGIVSSFKDGFALVKGEQSNRSSWQRCDSLVVLK